MEENFIECIYKFFIEVGFKVIEFDYLINYFVNDRVNYRGYLLGISYFEKSVKECEIIECEFIKFLKEKIVFNVYLKYLEM